jgi:hypothetical protein
LEQLEADLNARGVGIKPLTPGELPPPLPPAVRRGGPQSNGAAPISSNDNQMRDSIETFNFVKNADFSLDELCLNDLRPDMAATSRSDLQLLAALGDEELFKATAKIVVECMDYGGLYPSQAPGTLAGDCPSLVARHGEEAVFQMAKLIMSSEIHSLSKLFQSLFDSWNQKYFSGALDRYRVRVVFDLHTVADEPIDRGEVSSGLIRFEERRIYIRYTDADVMQDTLIHEMAHAATSGEHDQRWRTEMVRVKTAGAPVADWELR